jgi:hypothetical protein
MLGKSPSKKRWVERIGPKVVGLKVCDTEASVRRGGSKLGMDPVRGTGGFGTLEPRPDENWMAL